MDDSETQQRGAIEQNDSAMVTFFSHGFSDTGVAGQGGFSASPWTTSSGNEYIAQPSLR